MSDKYTLPSGKVIQISTNPRKRRRFLESEQAAQGARFWINKIKSADRTMLHDQPVDYEAYKIVHPRAHDLP